MITYRVHTDDGDTFEFDFDPVRPFFTIREEDVGKPCIRAFGTVWLVANHWGQTMAQDVGKRVYRVSHNVLQIENNEQRERRMK